MTERPTAKTITQEQLAALYDSLDEATEQLSNLKRVYEWSMDRWAVERNRLTSDIEWMRASAEPAELVAQLREATHEMTVVAEGSSEMDAWERRWAHHLTALGMRLQKAEKALGERVPRMETP